MPRTKKINAVVQYGDTGWIINDCDNGQFELYNISTKQILAKSNNPLDFDKHIDKIFGKEAARRVRDFQAKQKEGGNRRKYCSARSQAKSNARKNKCTG